jgi:tripartite-type tricarboxylate transporter receptor subunit TctC
MPFHRAGSTRRQAAFGPCAVAADSMNALLADPEDSAFGAGAEMKPRIDAGPVPPLALFPRSRLHGLPDVPTLGKAVAQ